MSKNTNTDDALAFEADRHDRLCMSALLHLHGLAQRDYMPSEKRLGLILEFLEGFLAADSEQTRPLGLLPDPSGGNPWMVTVQTSDEGRRDIFFDGGEAGTFCLEVGLSLSEETGTLVISGVLPHDLNSHPLASFDASSREVPLFSDTTGETPLFSGAGIAQATPRPRDAARDGNLDTLPRAA